MMKLKDYLKYVATPARVFMTLLILLLAVLILQTIIIETQRMLAYTKLRLAATKPKPKLTPEEERVSRIRDSAKEFLPDGTIHLVHKPRRTASRMDEFEPEQIYDVNDNLLWEGPGNKRPYEYLTWAKQLRSYRDGFTREQMKQIQMITPELSQTLEIPVGSSTRTEQVWRYHPRWDLFVGYRLDGRKIGYASSTGFTDSKSKVKPFGEFRFFTAWCPQDSYSPTLLWQTQRHIYQIDFEKQHVELIFESTEAEIEIERTSLHAWRDLKPGEKEYIDHKKYRPLLLCMTKDGKHHLILREPKQQLSAALPEDLRSASVTATKQDIFVRHTGSDALPPKDIADSRELLLQWWRERQAKPTNCWVELHKVDNEDNLDLLNRYDWTVPGRPIFEDPTKAFRRYMTQFSPPLYDLVVRLLGRKFWSRALHYQNRNDFFYSLVRMILDIRPYGGVINRVLSALMMGFAFLHGWPRRTSWAGFVFWLVFVGAFNLAGLLTYLALNHTAVIKCPVCGRRRGLTEVNCVRCEEDLPAPERGKLDLISY